MTYLIVYACTRAARQYRLEQECLMIDAELRRFGCPTSYSAVEPLGNYAHSKQAGPKTKSFRKWSRALFLAHDLLLGLAVFSTYTIAGIQANRVYWVQPDDQKWIGIVLTGYLIGATAAALFAVWASLQMRRDRAVVFQDYVQSKTEPAGASGDGTDSQP